MKKFVFEKLKTAWPDIKLIKEEYRMVNGVKMVHFPKDGTIQGIKFTYLGYYYSNESGTVQLLTYSSQKLMKENSGLCEELLNGLVELK